jgi:hypothetical protein
MKKLNYVLQCLNNIYISWNRYCLLLKMFGQNHPNLRNVFQRESFSISNWWHGNKNNLNLFLKASPIGESSTSIWKWSLTRKIKKAWSTIFDMGMSIACQTGLIFLAISDVSSSWKIWETSKELNKFFQSSRNDSFTSWTDVTSKIIVCHSNSPIFTTVQISGNHLKVS